MPYIIWRRLIRNCRCNRKGNLSYKPSLLLYGLANSEAFIQAEKYNVTLIQEADRTYKQDGTLTSRTEENALIKDEDEAIKQVLQMVKEGHVNSINGEKVAVQAQTICLHGDGEKQCNLQKEYTEHSDMMVFLYVHRNKNEGSVGIGEINRDIISGSGLLFRLNTLLVVVVAGIVTGMVSGLSFMM